MKITTQSTIIRYFLWTIFAIQIGLFILAWGNTLLSLDGGTMHVTPRGLTLEQMHSLRTDQRLLGGALGLGNLFLLLLGFWSLDQLLRSIQSTKVFALENIRFLRNFSAAMMCATFYAIIETPLRALAFRALPDLPKQALSIRVNSEELLLVLICSLFYLIINMMHEGRRLAEENEAFI
jgi:hypothetical protein